MTGDWKHRLLTGFRRQDKGFVILECVISLAMIAVLTLGYTDLTTQAAKAQRTAVNHSIAVQTAQGELEKIKATAFTNIGTDKASAVSLPYGVDPVVGGTVKATSASITVRGVAMTARTAVGWKKAPSGSSQYGVKLIIVEVTWRDVSSNSDTERTVSQQMYITPGIGEVVPSGIRGAGS